MGRKRLTNLCLPQYVYQWHGSYYYMQPGHPRVHIGRTLPEMEAAMKQIGISPTRMNAGHLGVILSTARRNARARDLPFALTRADLEVIWLRSGGKCELSLMSFDLLNIRGFARRPFAPSIDRIDSGIGYTPANCRLILVALNLAINEWGEEVFAKIAAAFMRRRRSPKYFTDPSFIAQG